MGYEEQLTILYQGVEAWNTWYYSQPEETRIDLSEEDLSGTNLSGAQLMNANLSGTNLSEANLNGANLNGAGLNEANLKRATLAGAFFRGASFSGADLSEATLSEATLIDANLSEANLRQASLHKAHLIDAFLSKADLSEADLSEADLIRATLSKALLRRTNLSSADLHEATLMGTNLSGADLRGANLRRANLSEANLGEANLSGADLSETLLRRTNLTHTDLTGAKVGWTIFGDLDVRATRGLETLVHVGPSTIGTDTLQRSQGALPEVFLRQAGIHESLIPPARSLFQSSVAFSSCFLSYASQDHVFTARLSADLWKQQVRCWSDPQILKYGELAPEVEIEKALRPYETFVLVLSVFAVRSPWVRFEVDAMLQRELREGRTILYALALDDSVQMVQQPWAGVLLGAGRILDFRGWQDPGVYQDAFEWILRVLRRKDGLRSVIR